MMNKTTIYGKQQQWPADRREGSQFRYSTKTQNSLDRLPQKTARNRRTHFTIEISAAAATLLFFLARLWFQIHRAAAAHRRWWWRIIGEWMGRRENERKKTILTAICCHPAHTTFTLSKSKSLKKIAAPKISLFYISSVWCRFFYSSTKRRRHAVSTKFFMLPFFSFSSSSTAVNQEDFESTMRTMKSGGDLRKWKNKNT